MSLGMVFALIGAVLSTALAGIGSAWGVGVAGQAAAGDIIPGPSGDRAEAPEDAFEKGEPV